MSSNDTRANAAVRRVLADLDEQLRKRIEYIGLSAAQEVASPKIAKPDAWLVDQLAEQAIETLRWVHRAVVVQQRLHGDMSAS